MDETSRESEVREILLDQLNLEDLEVVSILESISPNLGLDWVSTDVALFGDVRGIDVMWRDGALPWILGDLIGKDGEESQWFDIWWFWLISFFENGFGGPWSAGIYRLVGILFISSGFLNSDMELIIASSLVATMLLFILDDVFKDGFSTVLRLNITWKLFLASIIPTWTLFVFIGGFFFVSVYGMFFLLFISMLIFPPLVPKQWKYLAGKCSMRGHKAILEYGGRPHIKGSFLFLVKTTPIEVVNAFKEAKMFSTMCHYLTPNISKKARRRL